MPGELEGLLERVRKATGPDIEIDVDLRLRLDPAQWKANPRYTASIDAALALVERVLPEWNGDLTFRDPPACSLWDTNSVASTSASGNTPPLAILAALIDALIEKGRSDG